VAAVAAVVVVLMLAHRVAVANVVEVVVVAVALLMWIRRPVIRDSVLCFQIPTFKRIVSALWRVYCDSEFVGLTTSLVCMRVCVLS
jgi:hypothetical protein